MKNKIYIIHENDGCRLIYFLLGTKTKHKPLLQYLFPVGFGPSSKICP